MLAKIGFSDLESQIYMNTFLEIGDWSPAHPASHFAWIHTGFAVKLGYSVSVSHKPHGLRI